MGRQGGHEHPVCYACSILLSLLLRLHALSVWCSATIARRGVFIFDDVPPLPFLVLPLLLPVHQRRSPEHCVPRPRLWFGFGFSLESAVGVAVVVATTSWRARIFAVK